MGLEVLAGAALFSQATSAYGQKRAGDAAGKGADAMAAASEARAVLERKRAELESRRADIVNARSLRASIRQARIARAAVINAGANAGTSDSSGVIGGAGSVASQGAANTGFFGQMDEINDKVGVINAEIGDTLADSGRAQGDIYEAQADASRWGAFGNMAGTIFSASGGFETIFKSPKTA